MPATPIIMPQLGESIAEATVIDLLVAEGDSVSAGQDIMEVETQKATMNVTAPCDGFIEAFVVELGESYTVGDVLGQVQSEATTRVREDVCEPTTHSSHPPSPSKEVKTNAMKGTFSVVKPTIKGLPVPAQFVGAQYMSPRMKARMYELGLREADLSGIAGSGAGGRLTIQDFEKFLSQLEQSRLTQASSMRVAVADAMRRSWTRPLATVGRPVRLDAMLAHRSKMAPKPGPALFAIRALAIALSENSATAGRLIGNKIAHPASIDIGFAVEAEDGVLVPVIRHADKTSVQGMVSTYKELVASARQRKLPPNATGGSIATVTNFGTFGLTWATPIPLPEQTLVLGLGAGRKVPFWDTEQGCFVPITESQMTLSFDHRVLDGGAAGRLLTRVDALMANPESL
ncbi:2-oxo acid dehydrogenase subunit E2 [Verrucomicrobia bacterium]|jgi:pyruvate/2-oxoglutarate dehydrogenase complex dihydrolipoamide acyltransferase (E2) component|nr:2-oxo acid dehydrogenase subunit E2 [Verrucomicrobiota bacterium]MDC0268252.1 2-oxo acid dehydrogenase subunit E2 [bacterium]MDG1893195.1 2-oxo acid dehydrogenase subunit E2 [Verrucomicrobiota bacterium]